MKKTARLILTKIILNQILKKIQVSKHMIFSFFNKEILKINLPSTYSPISSKKIKKKKSSSRIKTSLPKK